jgi:hypothetical protein
MMKRSRRGFKAALPAMKKILKGPYPFLDAKHTATKPHKCSDPDHTGAHVRKGEKCQRIARTSGHYGQHHKGWEYRCKRCVDRWNWLKTYNKFAEWDCLRVGFDKVFRDFIDGQWKGPKPLAFWGIGDVTSAILDDWKSGKITKAEGKRAIEASGKIYKNPNGLDCEFMPRVRAWYTQSYLPYLEKKARA